MKKLVFGLVAAFALMGCPKNEDLSWCEYRALDTERIYLAQCRDSPKFLQCRQDVAAKVQSDLAFCVAHATNYPETK